MKMNALERLAALADYWESNRQVGHTSATMLGARNVPDTIVVVANDMNRQIVECVGIHGDQPKRQKTITIARLSHETLAGQRAPLVVDHHAMTVMIRDALREIQNLRRADHVLRSAQPLDVGWIE